MKLGSDYMNDANVPFKGYPYGARIPLYAWDIAPDILGFDPTRAYWFSAEYKIFGTLAEELELEFFPFDVCLSIYVSAKVRIREYANLRFCVTLLFVVCLRTMKCVIVIDFLVLLNYSRYQYFFELLNITKHFNFSLTHFHTHCVKFNFTNYDHDYCGVRYTLILSIYAQCKQCQDFGIHLQCVGNSREMDVLPLPQIGSYFSVDGRFSMVGEWNFKGLITEFIYKKATGAHPYACLSINFKAERKWYTHCDTLIITFCMYYLGIGMFSIPSNGTLYSY